MTQSIHIPVLLEAVLEQFAPQPGQTFVDGTLGGAGHAREIAPRLVPGGQLIALDRDRQVLLVAETTLAGMPVRLIHANYCDLPEVLAEQQVERVHAVLLDLGLSSDQLADPERGFSYTCEGPLDLRFDTTRGEPAWRLVNRLSGERLADLIYAYGEERLSRRIARRIVEQRKRQPIQTARQLAELVRSCVPRSRHHRIDPATRTFQALRIAVNDELKSLEIGLRRIPDCLWPGGLFGVISFHSLEDRRVKHAFREDPRLEVITRKPIRPEEQETQVNPRSRSARLRLARRVAEEKDRAPSG